MLDVDGEGILLEIEEVQMVDNLLPADLPGVVGLLSAGIRAVDTPHRVSAPSLWHEAQVSGLSFIPVERSRGLLRGC